MATVIHRCRVCKSVGRVQYRCEMRHAGYGRKEPVYFRESDGARNVQPVVCCGRPTTWNLLQAWRRPEVACNARCTHATGHNCECSCGGENHARAGGLFTNLLKAAA